MRGKGTIFLLGFAIVVISLTSAGVGNAFSQNISRDPADFFPYGGALGRTEPATVDITLYAHERTGSLDAGPDGVVGTADDVTYKFMTFGHDADSTTGKVPGPFLRVLEGDTVNFTLVNPGTNAATHSIDLHALKGTGGGAATLIAAPGASASLTAQVMHAGLFMYHCAGSGPSNIPSIAEHIANGMWGLILVEPRRGGYNFKLDRRRVDKEFYIMQSEYYLNADPGLLGGYTPGAYSFDFSRALTQALAENPDYVVFNGRAGVTRATIQYNPSGNVVTPVVMNVNVNDDVIIYFGDAGPNLVSSPHMIGDMWDREYHQGDVLSAPLRNIGTSTVPAAGTAIFAFKPLKTGLFVLVDHAVFRVAKGALGAMIVAP